ncbi:MAG: sulfatase-like hydrolase/transferase [Pseudomonadota bacterium]
MGLFIALSLITRIILLISSYAVVDFGALELVKIFVIGSFYDFVASIYYVIPFALYAVIVPNKLFNHPYHKYIIWVVLFSHINFLIFNVFSEYFFWDEFGKRFNFIAVDYLVYTHEVINNIIESYPIPLLLSTIFLISLGVFYFIYSKSQILNYAFFAIQSSRQALVMAMIFILLPILFFNILNKQSLTNISLNQYHNELAKNGYYSLFSAFRNNTLEYDEFYKTKDIKMIMSRLKNSTGFDGVSSKLVKKEGPELKHNVMLIMVESLSAEYMGVFGNTQGLTPHLDKLAKQSVFFNNFYATGTRTVRGMESVILSMVPTPGRSIVKRPDNHNMFSSGFVFRDKGYDNKFIYAGHGYFDNMNDFFSHNGFNVVDRTDITSDEITFSNVWGVCDEDLFNKALNESDKSYKKGKPFFNFIMTTSNHRPYTYPEGKIDIPSHTGRTGGVKYTDFAIDQFIDNAKQKPWFKNTLFIIVADHNGGSAGNVSLPVWRYKIPFLIYAPELLKPKIITKLSSQVDLMPTVFSMMNWSYESKFYGFDILSNNFKERAFIGTYQKLGFLRNNNLLVLEPDKSVHEYSIFNQTLTSSKYKEMASLVQDELDAITFYQSSSHLYKYNLNRWKL